MIFVLLLFSFFLKAKEKRKKDMIEIKSLIKPTLLLGPSLSYFRGLYFVNFVGHDIRTNTYYLDLVYDFAIKKDKEIFPGREKMIIGRVALCVQPGAVVDGSIAFSSENGVKKAEEAFQKFKNSKSPKVLHLQVGNAPDGSVNGILCTEAEALRLIFTYYWGRTVDLFTKCRSPKSKANSLNGRIGNSFERMVYHEVVFFQQTGLSFLNYIGEIICNEYNISPSDKVTYIQLPTKEKKSKAPIKTDIILIINGVRKIKISAKCPQTHSSDKDISVLGTGRLAGKSGLAETLFRGSKKAFDMFNWVNGRKLFNNLYSVGYYLSIDDLDDFFAVVKENYSDLVKLAVFGTGCPYAEEDSSQADCFVEHCLQDGHGLVCEDYIFYRTINNAPYGVLSQCFPLSGTKDHTARVSMNSELFLKAVRVYGREKSTLQ